MYDCTFICTYKMQEEYDDTKEKQLCNELYKIQLLDFFKINDLDKPNKPILDILCDRQKTLYDKFKNNSDIIIILNLLEKKYPEIENREILFTILFSYSYFYLFHKCLVDYILYNKFKEDNLQKLINIFNI